VDSGPLVLESVGGELSWVRGDLKFQNVLHIDTLRMNFRGVKE